MKTIKGLLADMDAIAVTGETRCLTDDEVTRYEGLESQFNALVAARLRGLE